MEKKEVFEKFTTAQFLTMKLSRKRKKEGNAKAEAQREMARILALLKAADGQTASAMSVILGLEAKRLNALLAQMSEEGLVTLDAPIDESPAAEDVAAEVEDVVAPEVGEEAEAADEADGEIAEDDASDEPAEDEAPVATVTIYLTEAGSEWIQPPSDLPSILLADFDEVDLDSFARFLDTFTVALEGEFGKTAAELMEEERIRREEAAESRDKEDRGDRRRDDRRDDRDRRGGYGDRDRGGRGGYGDRGGRYGDRDRGYGNRGGFGRDRDRDRGYGNRDRGGYGDRDRGGRGGYGDRDRDRGYGNRGGFGRDRDRDRDRGGYGRRS